MKKKRRLKKSVKVVFKVIICTVMLVLSMLCFKYIYDMDILPDKYLYILIGVILFINFISGILLFVKGIISKIFSVILYLILGIISIIGIKYAKNTIDYFNDGFSNSIVEYSTYNVIVANDSLYSNINELNDSVMGYLFLDVDNDKYLDVISDTVNVELKETDIYGIYEGLLDGDVNSIVINEAYIGFIEEQYSEFSVNTRILYSFNVEKETDTNVSKIEELKPVNIYLSGSDSRSGVINTSTLSDVNMIITINPNTHQILLTNIPRDFYVQLHGTTGLKDKLTHAGIYGIDMSRKTLEDLFGIEIDYSVKVGFNSVIKLVDLVGGIDVYSDKAFRSHCGDGGAERVRVVVGMNHFNGAQALSYARERYAYKDGDRHRGRNQQQVIEAVVSKIMNDKSILLKYDTLLSSLSDIYRTDIPKEFVTLFIKDQLENMSSWEFITQAVDGSGASRKTYSMPSLNLYVMIPNMDTVNAAIEKINIVSGLISEEPEVDTEDKIVAEFEETE